jgi:uncharacterized protein
MTEFDARPEFRVLALDGGGIRGYYTAVLLGHLASYFSGARADGVSLDIGRSFDLVVATSTGAILACSLCAGLPIERVIALYRRKGPEIFPYPAPIAWTSLLWCIRHWRKPSGNPAALRSALEGEFGSETLGELYLRRGTALTIQATDLDRLRARIFRTPHDAQHDGGALLVDVCMASCAAPILFAPVEINAIGATRAREVLGDGGLWANNPAIVALFEALAMAGPQQEIQVLSVSTCPSVGRTQQRRDRRHKGLGYWSSGMRLMHCGLDAQSIATAEVAQELVRVLKHPARVIRLVDPVLQPWEADELRIDNATSRAFDVMEDLAARAARLNIDRANGSSPGEFSLLQDFFRAPGSPRSSG